MNYGNKEIHFIETLLAAVFLCIGFPGCGSSSPTVSAATVSTEPNEAQQPNDVLPTDTDISLKDTNTSQKCHPADLEALMNALDIRGYRIGMNGDIPVTLWIPGLAAGQAHALDEEFFELGCDKIEVRDLPQGAHRPSDDALETEILLP